MVKDYAFSLSLGTMQEHHIGSHHFYSSSVLDTGAVTIKWGSKQRRKQKAFWIGKEEVKLFLYTGYMIIYIEKST